MDSNKLKLLKDYLDKKRFNYVESIRVHHSLDLIWLTVRQSAVAGLSSTTQTSRRQLNYLAKAIKRELDIDIEFLIARDEDQQNIEAGLNSLIKLQLPEAVRSCLLTLAADSSMNVWLEPAEGISGAIPPALEVIIREYLQIFKIQLGRIYWMHSDNVSPSLVEIVRMVKILAPASISQIENSLCQNGYQIPSTSWLQSKLDLARKRKLVIRTEEDQYVVTEGGLVLIPHSATANSSDVHRALALGKRKW